MKRLFLSLSLSLIAIGPQQLNAAPQFGRGSDRVCFYQDAQYRGWEQCYNLGDEVADLGGRKNAISSIRVYGRARVIVYEDDGFRGNVGEFESDVANLELRSISGSRTWNDRIDSIRIDTGFVRGGGFPSNNLPNRRDNDNQREGICIYEHADFRGRSNCFDAIEDIRDLARFEDWNDKISSIRVFGRARAVLYQDSGFRGETLFIDRDVHDLARLRLRGAPSWNDQVSSLQVEGPQGRGRNRNWR